MTKVFVDGSAGTTGLRILERLKFREDLVLLSLPEEKRKDPKARKEMMNQAEIVFLCLPDAAAREAVSLVENPDTAVIDTSTAHRTAEGWEYGFPELEGRRERIRMSRRVANPGCHASGFVALVEPLIRCGALSPSLPVSCFSMTGYSGGGKAMIADYEAERRDSLLDTPRIYGLSQHHKHLPEMTKISGLEVPPVFCPVVAPYYSGMECVVPLSAENLSCGTERLGEIYRDYYRSGMVRYAEWKEEEGFLPAGAFSGRDDMQIMVCGSEKRILLVSRFDNLGKGASGAAIQNMNLLLGVDETTGLIG